MKKSEEKKKKQTPLFSGKTSPTLLIGGLIFAVAVAVVIVLSALLSLPRYLGIFDIDNSYSRTVAVLILALTCIILGAIISYLASRVPIKFINTIVDAVNRLASGDYSARISLGEMGIDNPSIHDFAESFNRMASELDGTEMLRSDFVNNFSHEFKTPISSIAGFAKLLKKGNLTEEQRKEYLDIIEEESLRLSEMSTNVLSLTKLENQTILSNVARYNLSEQIRNCVLLLENKWMKKNLEIDIDFDEFYIEANSEILKEVWINLLDNAVKYSDEGGMITVGVRKEGQNLRVDISNTGFVIPPEKIETIYNKFYQADESHSAMGTGVGLAIVKKAVSLHNGEVSVTSADGKTSFSVVLPEKPPKIKREN